METRKLVWSAQKHSPWTGNRLPQHVVGAAVDQDAHEAMSRLLAVKDVVSDTEAHQCPVFYGAHTVPTGIKFTRD
jgi:hypothetical protein